MFGMQRYVKRVGRVMVVALAVTAIAACGSEGDTTNPYESESGTSDDAVFEKLLIQIGETCELYPAEYSSEFSTQVAGGQRYLIDYVTFQGFHAEAAGEVDADGPTMVWCQDYVMDPVEYQSLIAAGFTRGL